MKLILRCLPLLALSAHVSVFAQATEDADAKAKAALSKQEGDVDSAKLLAETLSVTKSEYSLLRKGKYSMSYGAAYTYLGRERINANFSDGRLTLFNISNESQHTLTNTFSGDYGFLDNLTITAALPVIATYAQNPRSPGVSYSLGDLSMGVRWQPFGVTPGRFSTTVNASVRMPTGRSPFKGIADTGEASGSGLWQANLGLNASKVIDPVALFGSVTLGASRSAKDLSQARGTRILTGVAPGPSIGFGFGMAYALSYAISTTISFQETWSRATRLTFADGARVSTQSQTSATLSFGVGVKVTPKTLINTQVGIGLTESSPNFTLDVSIPFQF